MISPVRVVSVTCLVALLVGVSVAADPVPARNTTIGIDVKGQVNPDPKQPVPLGSRAVYFTGDYDCGRMANSPRDNAFQKINLIVDRYDRIEIPPGSGRFERVISRAYTEEIIPPGTPSSGTWKSKDVYLPMRDASGWAIEYRALVTMSYIEVTATTLRGTTWSNFKDFKATEVTNPKNP
jgi:hypothetical protein